MQLWNFKTQVPEEILSKFLKTRIKSVIKSVIQPDQTVYVPGKYIDKSVRLISDILEYTDDHSLPGFFVTADIEKAFDSIEHPFIVATLKKLGFGPTFINWVKVLLFKQESCVMNNGHNTSYFNCSRGARQGDPLICLFIYFGNRDVVHTSKELQRDLWN